MHKSIPALVMGAAAAVPAGNALAAASHATPKVTVHKVKGPAVDMRWGTVQVVVVIKGNKITNVKASAPMERARSAFINQQALPMLKSEVLQAQSGNIDLISGATMTSEAYQQSLQAALTKAHFK